MIVLVVAGFVLAGYLDSSSAAAMPPLSWLQHLPPILRATVEILVGVPIAFGVALYLITQLLEVVIVVTWPVRKVIAMIHRSPWQH